MIFNIVDSSKDVEVMTPYGRFLMAAVQLSDLTGKRSEHLCLYRGMTADAECLVRLNSACITSELLGCRRCDCSWQLEEALRLFQHSASCALVYSPGHEGRGHGLVAKLKTYQSSDGSVAGGLDDRYRASDLRDFRDQAFIARWLGVRRAHLLSDNPAKRAALSNEGIEVVRTQTLRDPSAHMQPLYRRKDQTQAAYRHIEEDLR